MSAARAMRTTVRLIGPQTKGKTKSSLTLAGTQNDLLGRVALGRRQDQVHSSSFSPPRATATVSQASRAI